MTKCSIHKHYQGKNIPYSNIDCKECWNYYEYKHPMGMTKFEFRKMEKNKIKKKVLRKTKINTSIGKREYKKLLQIYEDICLNEGEYYNDFINEYSGDPGEYVLSMQRANMLFYMNTTCKKSMSFIDIIYEKHPKSIGLTWLKLLKSNVSKLEYIENETSYNADPLEYSKKMLYNYKDYFKTKYIDAEEYIFI